MKKKLVSHIIAPAIGPYSQAIQFGDLIFTSGQIPMDMEGNLRGNDIKSQTRIVLQNITHLLEDNHSSVQNAVKVTVYLTDMNNFSAMNEVYSEYFSDSLPARTTVEVSRLPKDVLVEIDCIAHVNVKKGLLGKLGK
ncbi:MAG TPA: Rid family detoxifying hydrolase [Ignavibacteria bacterium]|nr:Rid family detoxifying hydrolase [Ignavibacteria bacterium]